MRHHCFAATLPILLLMTACATPPPVPPAMQASIHFQEGERLFEKGLYPDAIAAWEKVRASYYSPELNTLVELKIAEAYFLDDKYIEATAAYEAFLKSQPDHPRVQDVLYQLGLCYQRQMLKIDQDQTTTRQALAAFETLLQRYPQDPRQEEVRSYIAACLAQLAAHEVIVGRYYLKAGKYQAAINRFEGVFRKYPAYPNGAEVYYHLGQAYLLNGEPARSDEAFNLLFNRFPNSKYVADAEKFIRKKR
jgi:outer membrane protein assembly factor BamD